MLVAPNYKNDLTALHEAPVTERILHYGNALQTLHAKQAQAGLRPSAPATDEMVAAAAKEAAAQELPGAGHLASAEQQQARREQFQHERIRKQNAGYDWTDRNQTDTDREIIRAQHMVQHAEGKANRDVERYTMAMEAAKSAGFLAATASGPVGPDGKRQLRYPFYKFDPCAAGAAKTHEGHPCKKVNETSALDPASVGVPAYLHDKVQVVPVDIQTLPQPKWAANADGYAQGIGAEAAAEGEQLYGDQNYFFLERAAGRKRRASAYRRLRRLGGLGRAVGEPPIHGPNAKNALAPRAAALLELRAGHAALHGQRQGQGQGRGTRGNPMGVINYAGADKGVPMYWAGGTSVSAPHMNRRIGQFEPPVHDQKAQGPGPSDPANFRVDPTAGPAGDVPKKSDTRVPIAHGGVGGKFAWGVAGNNLPYPPNNPAQASGFTPSGAPGAALRTANPGLVMGTLPPLIHPGDRSPGAGAGGAAGWLPPAFPTPLEMGGVPNLNINGPDAYPAPPAEDPRQATVAADAADAAVRVAKQHPTKDEKGHASYAL